MLERFGFSRDRTRIGSQTERELGLPGWLLLRMMALLSMSRGPGPLPTSTSVQASAQAITRSSKPPSGAENLTFPAAVSVIS